MPSQDFAPAVAVNELKLPQDGNTPLHKAILAGDFAEAKKLLKAGANCHAENNKAETPLQLVAEHRATEKGWWHLLLSYGAGIGAKLSDDGGKQIKISREALTAMTKGHIFFSGVIVDTESEMGMLFTDQNTPGFQECSYNKQQCIDAMKSGIVFDFPALISSFERLKTSSSAPDYLEKIDQWIIDLKSLQNLERCCLPLATLALGKIVMFNQSKSTVNAIPTHQLPSELKEKMLPLEMRL